MKRINITKKQVIIGAGIIGLFYLLYKGDRKMAEKHYNILKINTAEGGLYGIYKISEEGIRKIQESSMVVLHDSGVDISQSAYTIDRYHTIIKGWRGIGYDYLLDKDKVYETFRSFTNTSGAHTLGYNTDSIGICIEGKTKIIPDMNNIYTMINTIIHYNPHIKFYYHGQLNNTACFTEPIYQDTFNEILSDFGKEFEVVV